MTVSKALRNHQDISEETRRRIVKRARELGYQPNWIARSLVTRRTYTVGLVLPDLMHSFFAEVAKGAARKLEARGYQMVIADSEEDDRKEQQQISTLLARSLDGLIIASAQKSGRGGVFSALRDQNVPYVLIDRIPPGLSANSVAVKDEEIGALATGHLIEQGCRRIAHIRGPEISTGKGRLRGYERALARHGLPANPGYVVRGEHRDNTGFEAMRRLLDLDPRPDGVFCYNDPVAAGAIKAILEADLRVPDDIAVVGAGNVHYSDLLRVPVSTIDQSSLAMGEAAAELLMELIAARKRAPPRQIWIAPALVVRESSRRQGKDGGSLVHKGSAD